MSYVSCFYPKWKISPFCDSASWLLCASICSRILQSCWLNCPTVLITLNGFKTRLTVYQRGLEIVSLCRCNNSGRTFFSVVFETFSIGPAVDLKLQPQWYNTQVTEPTWQQNIFCFSWSSSPVNLKLSVTFFTSPTS